MYAGSYVVSLFKKKVASQKNDLFATLTLKTLTLYNNLFATDSLTTFIPQIVHSHIYCGKIYLHQWFL